MKKLVALLVCVMMLVSACAFAEGTEWKLGNVQLVSGDQVVADLSGIDLRFGVGQNDSYAGILLGILCGGEETFNLVAAANEDSVVLTGTGISNAYGISMQDLASIAESMVAEMGSNGMGGLGGISFSDEEIEQMTALFMNVVAEISASMQPAAAEEINGETYEVYTYSFTNDQIVELLNGFAQIIDNHPEILSMMELDGTLTELFASVDYYGDINGKVYTNDNGMILEENITSPDMEEAVKIVLNIGSDGTFAMTIGTEEMTVITLDGSLVFVGDEFGSVEATLSVSDGYETVFLKGKVVAPVSQAEGLWEVSLSSDDFTFELQVGTDLEGKNRFWMDIAAEGEIATISYVGTENTVDLVVSAVENGAGDTVTYNYVGENGNGNIYLGVDAEGIQAGITATIEKTETDASWLPTGEVQYVDVLTITDADINTLYQEGQTAIMNVVMAAASANQNIAALLGM